MGKIDVKDFLSHYIKPKRGKALNEKGEEIGEHDGAVFLTIGERRGFVITKKTPNEAPYFIVAKDIKKNTITVAHRASNGILLTATKEVTIKNVNLITLCKPGFNKLVQTRFEQTNLTARVRYRQPLQRVRIRIQDSRFKNGDKGFVIQFQEPQIIAAGQSLVLYRGEECLGGGIIS